jgi:hypothetical protein
MKRSVVLAVDAAINIVLGVLLIVFPHPLVNTLGVPASQSAFYPSILGSVLLGVGIALAIQVSRGERPDGLGLWGAMTINLCGGFALAAWLLWGSLNIPMRGRVFLWSLVGVLVGVSLVELAVHRTQEGR